jgi:hypothetical protein
MVDKLRWGGGQGEGGGGQGEGGGGGGNIWPDHTGLLYLLPQQHRAHSE